VADLVHAKEMIETLRWHIARADAQRSGLWTRAAAVLSANALVVAGTAVMASAGSGAAWWGLITAILPLAASMISIYEASNIIAAYAHGRNRALAAWDSPTPILYSLPATVDYAQNYDNFRLIVTSRTMEKKLNNAIAELWRISVLHRSRLGHLRRALLWFEVSVPLLVLSGGTIIASLALR
jgi:hypothetical protein